MQIKSAIHFKTLKNLKQWSILVWSCLCVYLFVDILKTNRLSGFCFNVIFLFNINWDKSTHCKWQLTSLTRNKYITVIFIKKILSNWWNTVTFIESVFWYGSRILKSIYVLLVFLMKNISSCFEIYPWQHIRKYLLTLINK